MQFETGQDSAKRDVLNFLESVDPGALSREVLSNTGWGDNTDPIEAAINILIKRVEKW
jgi:hypothetical protein